MRLIGATLLLLCTVCSWRGSSADRMKVKFVDQVSVQGCALFVHDSGRPDGPHLVVEPAMCVTDLDRVTAQKDPIANQTYVSIRVVMKDPALLAGVSQKLAHLSPRSLQFANASAVLLYSSSDSKSVFDSLGFVWSPEESVGYIRLGCRSTSKVRCSAETLASRLRAGQLEELEQFKVSATIYPDGRNGNYLPIARGIGFLNLELDALRYLDAPMCQLRFVRTIVIGNCLTPVYERTNDTRDYLIEPLLCHDVKGIADAPILHDYSQDKHYMSLNITMNSTEALAIAQLRLADLQPRSVAFMRLCGSRSSVSSELRSRYSVGQLDLSVDSKMGRVYIYCLSRTDCESLRSGIAMDPVNLWRHIEWTIVSLSPDGCLHATPSKPRFAWRMNEAAASGSTNSRLSSLLLDRIRKFRLLV